MKAQLAEVKRELEHAEARLERLAEGIPAERWSARSDPARWSPAECIAHLNLTSQAYIPLIQQAIGEGRRLPPMTRRRYRRDFVGWMFGTMTRPIPSIGKLRIGRVKTTTPFVPTGELPQNLLLAEFRRCQLELVRLLGEGDGLQLDRVKIVSPFAGRIRYNCYSAFRILPPHQERHLQQAELVWG